MRYDQFVGLNERAQELIKGEQELAYTEEVVRIYPDGGQERMPDRPVFESTVKKEESGESYTGMFTVEYPLHKYTFPNGQIYYERLQTAPWSSGPVHFLALQNEDGKWVPESLWTDEEIRQNT
ncbi:hypothetical protein HZB94_04980 [Candidatus Falkowbacteria bacterium]|nr:hypothetical protein [Candidatus Falkowbacteria bacterium]